MRVRIACGVFNVALGVLLLASVRWLGSLTWLAVLPLAGAALIFWTVNRLQQDSALRVRELEQSRARVVDDSAARLRRIERDLHDGAQAQMVAVAMKLGLAREKLSSTADGTGQAADLKRVRELVDDAHRSAKQAITDLRDLARGIHPPVLDHGLAAALASLAARSETPVELVVDLPERPSAAIETIAYFCVAELLANVAKHSGARRVRLEAAYVGRPAQGAGQRRRRRWRPPRKARRPGRAGRARGDRGRHTAGEQPAPRPYRGHRRVAIARLTGLEC